MYTGSWFRIEAKYKNRSMTKERSLIHNEKADWTKEEKTECTRRDWLKRNLTSEVDGLKTEAKKRNLEVTYKTISTDIEYQ